MYKTHVIVFGWTVPHETDFTVITPKLLHEIVLKIKPPPTENVCLYGIYTYVPKEHHSAYEKFINHLEDKIKLSHFLRDNDSIGIIVNNLVLYLDLSNNLENFDSHPYTSIGKMYMLREFLSELFPNTTYLKQNMKWARDAIEKYTEKHMTRIDAEVNLKILELLTQYKQESSSSHQNCNHSNNEPCCSEHQKTDDKDK